MGQSSTDDDTLPDREGGMADRLLQLGLVVLASKLPMDGCQV